MKIKIVVIGTLKEKLYNDRIQKYLKWIARDIKIELVYIKDSQHKKIEQQINRLKKQKFFNVCLSEKGDLITSQIFSDFIFNKNQNIAFLIGGPDGHPKSVFDKSDYILSLSKMTFPHEMSTLVLTEQIFRAISIKKGTKYHRC
ncbi:MAG: hypothetical protein CMG55_03745 [Candidatus Marinimicrobia bacterium]|nr:hypothetical protein [Candidatus Neomarinimicrobiota bacterium]|tara:strand:- start:2013 stop:2444 length:432 start_codon:yes stop_codon:yes gene_type:complete